MGNRRRFVGVLGVIRGRGKGSGGESRGVAVYLDHGGGRVSPDLLDTFRRARQAYALVNEPPPTPSRGAPQCSAVDHDARDARSSDGFALEAFSGAAEQFLALTGWLAGEQARGLEHAQLEARLEADGRELIRALLQDHLDLRAGSERRLELVVGAERGAPCERRACASASARDGVRRGRGQAARVSRARR